MTSGMGGNRMVGSGRLMLVRRCTGMWIAVGMLLAGACAGESTGVSSTDDGSMPSVHGATGSSAAVGPSTSPAPGTAPGTTAVSTTVPAVAGDWDESAVVLSTEGIATQPDVPPELPDVHVIGSTSAGYLVAGSVNGGFTVWRSTNLASFEPVYSEVCCDRQLRAASIGELDGSILIGGTGWLGPDRTEQAFVLRSDDGGASWVLIDDPVFRTAANRVDRFLSTGGVVIAEAVDDRATGAQPSSVAAWSDDLVTWHPIDLPGRRSDDWPWFASDEHVVFGLAQRVDPDGFLQGWVVWRSVDGGRTFDVAPALTGSVAGSGGFVVVDGSLVGLPSAIQRESGHVDAQGAAVLRAGGWELLPPDTGAWGDGAAGLYPNGTTAAWDRTYALVGRETFASVHYCYDDPAACQTPETALMSSRDGTTWLTVAGFPRTQLVSEALTIANGVNDGIVVIAAVPQDPATDRERFVHITRWTGVGPPTEAVAQGYPPPEIPVPLYDHAQPLEIGEERRYPLPLGGCGGMYLGEQRWEPDSPIPDPPPANWPYKEANWVDGPRGFVYGRVRLVDADTIEFSIEGVGPVATFRPAPPPETVCG